MPKITSKTQTCKNLLVVPLLLCLTACSTIPQSTTKNYHRLDWTKRIAQLKNVNQWLVNGSFSIHYTNNTDMAFYQWQQQHNAYKINISSPLNLVHFDLYGNPKQIVLQKSAYKIYTAKTPEKLLQKQIGWELPISNLVYWIRGMPAPNSACKIKLDSYNHLLTLKQQGWAVHYTNFTNIADIDLPANITLENSQLKIKIVMKNWQLTSSLPNDKSVAATKNK